VPEDLALSPGDALVEAQRLLDDGRPFHAHEVLEAAWKAAPEAERDLWQGLAQLAVGLTHALRGNSTGAATLLRRGADHISGYAEVPPYGVDVTGLLDWARSSAVRLDDPSNDAATPSTPVLRG
jgi:predicted metal-dependent hydrolase